MSSSQSSQSKGQGSQLEKQDQVVDVEFGSEFDFSNMSKQSQKKSGSQINKSSR